MKKTLSLFVALLLLLSSFAALAEGDTSKDTWLCDEKTTLTVLTYDAASNTMPAPSNDLSFWAWLEDYNNEFFVRYSARLFSFPEVRAEMAHLQGKGPGGKVNLKKFLDGLLILAEEE